MTHKRWAAAVLSMTMVMAFSQPLWQDRVEAASSSSSVQAQSSLFKPEALKTVRINAQSYLEVNDVQFYHVDGEKIVYYTVTVHNSGKQSLNLMDYWFSIKSNTGEKYSIQLMGLQEKKDNLITANTVKTFKIYTKVNPKLNLSNLSLHVIKWDFSVPGFERSIGSISIPATYSNVTPIGKDRSIKQGENTVVATASALQLVKSGNATEAMVSMYFKNTSNSSIKIDSYKYYLRTNTNRYYTLDPDQLNLSVLPGEKVKVNFYAKLPDDLGKQTYQIFVTEETGTEKKTALPVASYALMIRDSSKSITRANQSYSLNIDNQAIESKITNTMVDSTAEYHNVTLTYQLTNKGKKAVAVPKHSYELVTDKQISYPFEKVELTGELLPGISKEITMTASLPVDSNIKNLKLITKRIAEENKKNDYLLAQYLVPEKTGVTEGTTTRYVNKQGAYEVTVENFERLPWDTQDIINATITVKNIGKETQPMPKMNATAWLNGVKVDAKDIQLLPVEEAIALKPGDTAKLIATSKVSSQSKFDSARIQLSEIINEKPVNTIGNFMVAAENANLPIYTPGSTAKYALKQPGVDAEMGVLESGTYEGVNNNVVRTLLLYRNSGQRYAKLPALKAYYKTSTGIYIPAKVTLSDKELSPQGANLIAISADVPKNIKKQDLQIIVGQGITGGKYVSGTEKAESFVNAAILALGQDDTKVTTLFEPMELRPFTFKINSVNARTNDNDNVQFNFNYTLSEYSPFQERLADRKIVVQVEYYGKKFDKVFQLGSGTDSLAVGEKISQSFNITDPAMKGVGNTGFRLNLYEEVDGARKLLMNHFVGNFGSE
ncbi:hypothetical protein [Paenibacillus sp. UMB4589-SE434]|uniref:hypothetical protein n=1 Tax=Paenibacillus sp. UMB4589-SE434 TaxID=3046314 RepID=UPI00254B7E0A|nr:hypothetical protein [Paenibacillus sp. UMB4589-SE434]MDK8181615.1 hypothetical protein [Paenibacillus sp. UMB4589-SE434]